MPRQCCPPPHAALESSVHFYPPPITHTCPDTQQHQDPPFLRFRLPFYRPTSRVIRPRHLSKLPLHLLIAVLPQQLPLIVIGVGVVAPAAREAVPRGERPCAAAEAPAAPVEAAPATAAAVAPPVDGRDARSPDRRGDERDSACHRRRRADRNDWIPHPRRV